jgi:C1A family cysteine protease
VRREIFVKNLETARRHNSKTDAFKMGINQFADLSFKELYDLNYSSDESYAKMDTSKIVASENEELTSDDFKRDVPDSFDWRDMNISSSVKDQGMCGSCYAFAVLEEIESQIMIKTNKSYELSRQELMDCAKNGFGSLGCGGGLLYGVHYYIKAREGISEAKDYPYEANESECRREKVAKVTIKLKDIRWFETNDEDILKQALYTFGPVAAIIDNLHDSFFRYSHGIYYEPECEESELYSHAIVIVGFGSDSGEDYWTIKNSYGERWGEKGYMRIARNRDNHCKIASFNMLTKL